MNLAFVWYWDRASEIKPNWRDGLRSAIEQIEKNHHVGWYLDEEAPLEGFYDAILFWGDSESPFFGQLDRYKAEKKGLCLSTMPTNFDNLRKLDVVFCESTPVYEAVRAQGVHAVKAFGTDTEFYTPKADVKKDIEYFYPATFSPWKRQRDIAKLGNLLLCVGTVQPDGEEDLQACREKGVQIEIGYFPPEKIREYYQRAKEVVIPAVHGSERTVLESMSMNIRPQVNINNHKAYSYIKEFDESGFLFPRDFVVKHYSHVLYAKTIVKGLS